MGDWATYLEQNETCLLTDDYDDDDVTTKPISIM